MLLCFTQSEPAAAAAAAAATAVAAAGAAFLAFFTGKLALPLANAHVP